MQAADCKGQNSLTTTWSRSRTPDRLVAFQLEWLIGGFISESPITASKAEPQQGSWHRLLQLALSRSSGCLSSTTLAHRTRRPSVISCSDEIRIGMEIV
eukprot:s5201_g3.t1